MASITLLCDPRHRLLKIAFETVERGVVCLRAVLRGGIRCRPKQHLWRSLKMVSLYSRILCALHHAFGEGFRTPLPRNCRKKRDLSPYSRILYLYLLYSEYFSPKSLILIDRV